MVHPLKSPAPAMRAAMPRVLPLAARQSIESDLLALDNGLKFLGEVLPARGLSDAQAQAGKVRQPLGQTIGHLQEHRARAHSLLQADIAEIVQLLQRFADQVAAVDASGYSAVVALQRLAERAARTLTGEDRSPDVDLAAPLPAGDSPAGCLLNSVAELCDQMRELARNLIADMEDQALVVSELVAIREMAAIGGLKADSAARMLGFTAFRGDAAADWLFAPGEGGPKHG